jgi:hypothetical protein
MINEWDAQWNKNTEGVYSLRWAGQEEESWRKFGIVVGGCEWVVGYLSCEWIVRDTLFFGFPTPTQGLLIVEM